MISIARRRIPLLNDDGRGVMDGYEYVDLKLPSGKLWATCNVGASVETGYGNYYQWGSDDVFVKNTQQYVVKQGILSNKRNMTWRPLGGTKWRVAYLTEFTELINNTNASFETIDGINGMKFTSKRNPNAYIFFRAGGFYRNSGTRASNGSGVYYWAATYNWTQADADVNANQTVYFYSGSSSTNSTTTTRGIDQGLLLRYVHV